MVCLVRAAKDFAPVRLPCLCGWPKRDLPRCRWGRLCRSIRGYFGLPMAPESHNSGPISGGSSLYDRPKILVKCVRRKILHLGVIGTSEGNGHPYSWAAIFNGYDAVAMEQCGFPVIPRYLEKQRFPEDCIPDAKVTHIWTQDRFVSKKIAKAAKILNVVEHMDDLIGPVDGILLARDDAKEHLRMALPFLQAGIPIYVDKPLALSLRDAEIMIQAQKYEGQLFSCSALRYAPEMLLTKNQMEKLGPILAVHAFVPKSWDTYAPHAIEPLLRNLPFRGEITRSRHFTAKDEATLFLEFSGGIAAQIHAMGQASSPIQLKFFSMHHSETLTFSDAFRAFRAALNDFVQGILNRDVRISPSSMLEVVRIMELGHA